MKLSSVTAAAVLVAVGVSCAGDSRKAEHAMKNYYRALAATDPAKAGVLKAGSKAEREAIQLFVDFYRVYAAEVIKKDVRKLYAPSAFFRDPFREVEGIDAIEPYFLSAVEPIHECTFDIQDVAVHGGEYYFRWVMHLRLKRDKDSEIRTVGMSHVRFDAEGRVVFQQDYWDAGAVYERLPVIGGVIRWIKRRI